MKILLVIITDLKFQSPWQSVCLKSVFAFEGSEVLNVLWKQWIISRTQVRPQDCSDKRTLT